MKANSSHNARRIIAEDPDWNLILVPSLSDLSLYKILNSPSFSGVLTILLSENVKLSKNIVKKLPSTIPLHVSVPFINDQLYWNMKYQTKWNSSRKTNERYTWKQIYLQRYLQELIEGFFPVSPSTDVGKLSAQVNLIESSMHLFADYVFELVLNQLQISGKDRFISDECLDSNDFDQDIIGQMNQIEHFSLSTVFKFLYNLESIEICYGVNNVGMNFKWEYFSVSDQDCKDIADGLKLATKLKKITIVNSTLNSKQSKLICGALSNHPSVASIDFSHNKICDVGFKIFGKLLSLTTCILTNLDLSNNIISSEGSKVFSIGLERNSSLQYLNLRLNKIRDEGADFIFRALHRNITLRSINLSSNMLTELSCKCIADTLSINKTLLCIDLSCNLLEDSGGKILQERMDQNISLLEINLSLTYISHESETFISQAIERNQKLTLIF